MRTLWILVTLLPLLLATPASAGKPALPQDPLARIAAIWGQKAPATRHARDLLAKGAHATLLTTPIGPVAVVEGEVMLVVPPSGRPHWWVGNPSRDGKPVTPEGEAVDGEGGALLELTRANDTSWPGVVPNWPGLPVVPAGKDRVFLAFDWNCTLDRNNGVRLVTVTRDRVQWDAPDVSGHALVDVDRDTFLDRARLEHLNFGPCPFVMCGAKWWEFDVGDATLAFHPAGAKAREPYGKLAKSAQAQLEKLAKAPDCETLRDDATALYRYALLGGVDVAQVRMLVGALLDDVRLRECRSPHVGKEGDEPDSAELQVNQRAYQVLTCLGKPGPLDDARWEACTK